MKKNSETRNGRYLSPRLPSWGRRIWSRTSRMAISPRFCAPRGTIFGLRKAMPKNSSTITATSRTSTIGLVTSKMPILNSGLNRKSVNDGAG